MSGGANAEDWDEDRFATVKAEIKEINESMRLTHERMLDQRFVRELLPRVAATTGSPSSSRTSQVLIQVDGFGTVAVNAPPGATYGEIVGSVLDKFPQLKGCGMALMPQFSVLAFDLEQIVADPHAILRMQQRAPIKGGVSVSTPRPSPRLLFHTRIPYHTTAEALYSHPDHRSNFHAIFATTSTSIRRGRRTCSTSRATTWPPLQRRPQGLRPRLA